MFLVLTREQSQVVSSGFVYNVSFTLSLSAGNNKVMRRAS